jgi:hypothetical protein
MTMSRRLILILKCRFSDMITGVAVDIFRDAG